MDDGLKQRLIGALVLLAIGVIFLPVLFDRQRIRSLDHETRIPIAPDIQPITFVESSKPEPTIAAKPAEENFVPNENNPPDLAAELPTLNQQGVPKAWVIQVASYRFEAHANELRNKLKADGYKAYTREVQMDTGNMVRLYVGPKLDKNRALKALQDIEEKHKVKGLLLRFEP